MNNEINLGDKATDKVSGFSGIVTAICEYLYGETRYRVTAESTVDGAIKAEWFSLEELSTR